MGVGAGGPALGDRDPYAARHLPHRRGIVHPQPLHEEGEGVPGLVAHEAVEHSFLRDDREVAVRPAVERARPAEIRAGTLELDVLADDPHQVRRLADLLDDVIGDQAHPLSSAIVTPWPP